MEAKERSLVKNVELVDMAEKMSQAHTHKHTHTDSMFMSMFTSTSASMYMSSASRALAAQQPNHVMSVYVFLVSWTKAQKAANLDPDARDAHHYLALCRRYGQTRNTNPKERLHLRTCVYVYVYVYA